MRDAAVSAWPGQHVNLRRGNQFRVGHLGHAALLAATHFLFCGLGVKSQLTY